MDSQIIKKNSLSTQIYDHRSESVCKLSEIMPAGSEFWFFCVFINSRQQRLLNGVKSKTARQSGQKFSR